MYEFAFREAGIRLPFNSFQMSVFKWLRLAPSQLHPNALAFMRAFELVCQFLGIGCTRALFFHVFHLQRSGSRGRHSWVSFKQPVRLFKTYEDSVRHFKNRWYVVMPITRAALHSLYYYQRKPNGEETLMSKIPLRWQRDHFDLSTAHYRVKYAMLGEEDRLAYKKLVDYVQSFSLGFWANRQGVPYLDEAGELITEARYINTKALLECDTEEEALALLSAMPNARDRVLKLANQVGAPDRVPKKKKKTVARPLETAGDAGASPSQAASVIPSSPPRSNPINIPDSSPSPAASPLHKRKRPAGALPGRLQEAEESIAVPAPEAKAILDQDVAARRKDLARDIAAVIRVMETAMVLTDTSVSTASLEDALLQVRTEKERLSKDLSDYKEEHQLQEGLSQKLEEVEKERDQLKAAKASLEEQVVDHQKLTEDNAGLRAQVESLEGKVRPLADETEEERALGSRGELLGHIRTLNQDLVACFKEGFDNAVEQLGLLNPELVTVGSAYNCCVRDVIMACVPYVFGLRAL
ncbi:uncharacterized protein LOC127079311 [Lathyrus oleraceus]|uniref:uncharacterized protein LOC127079311 n=1 Tax=Pisum sativum TaxID=3888 RepID=UPI0021CF1120|nr:uncharacterized protein LOC127079311 [Pisum sativum]